MNAVKNPLAFGLRPFDYAQGDTAVFIILFS